MAFPDGSGGKEPACQYRRHKRCGSNLWVDKTPLEDGMASPCSILAWRIPRTEEPGGATAHGVTSD